MRRRRADLREFLVARGRPGIGRRRAGRHAGLRGRFDGEHILVPILTAEAQVLADQIEIARTLACASGASLSVIDPHGDGASRLDGRLERTTDPAAQLDGDLLRPRDVVTGVCRAIRTLDVDTLVVPGGSGSGRLRREAIEQIAAHAGCDVVVVNGEASLERVASILLPVTGGPHAGHAADVARSIAAAADAWIDVLHVIEEDASDRRRERAHDLVEATRRRIARPETTTTWVPEATDAAETIVEQARYYGVTVIGAPTKGRLRRLISGSTNRSVRANAGSVVLSVRANGRRAPGDG